MSFYLSNYFKKSPALYCAFRMEMHRQFLLSCLWIAGSGHSKTRKAILKAQFASAFFPPRIQSLNFLLINFDFKNQSLEKSELCGEMDSAKKDDRMHHQDIWPRETCCHPLIHKLVSDSKHVGNTTFLFR